MTRMPRDAKSRAAGRVIPTIAPLDAAYLVREREREREREKERDTQRDQNSWSNSSNRKSNNKKESKKNNKRNFLKKKIKNVRNLSNLSVKRSNGGYV